jgi:hypothetical protein
MCDFCIHIELQKRLGGSASIGIQGSFSQKQAPPGSVAVPGLPAKPLGNTQRPKPYKGKGRLSGPPQTPNPTPTPSQPKLERVMLPDGTLRYGRPITNSSSSGPVAPMHNLPLRPPNQPPASPFTPGVKRGKSDLGSAPASTGLVKKTKGEVKHLLLRGTWTWSDWIQAYNETSPIEGCERAYFEDSINNRIIALWEESERLTVTPKLEVLEPMTKPVSSDILTLFEKAEFLKRRRSHLRIILTPFKGDTRPSELAVPGWSEHDAKLHLNQMVVDSDLFGVDFHVPPLVDNFDYETPRDILAHLRILQCDLLLIQNKKAGYWALTNKARTGWIDDVVVPILRNCEDTRLRAESILTVIRRFRNRLQLSMTQFGQGVTFVAQALLEAVQKTCKEGGVWDPKDGIKVGKTYDPEAVRILKIDTLRAITAIELLRISYLKKVAWAKATTDLELAHFDIDENIQDCLDNLIGVHPHLEGLHGFPRLHTGSVPPPEASDIVSTEQTPKVPQGAVGVSGT